MNEYKYEHHKWVRQSPQRKICLVFEWGNVDERWLTNVDERWLTNVDERWLTNVDERWLTRLLAPTWGHQNKLILANTCMQK